jgi:hypothetical protein
LFRYQLNHLISLSFLRMATDAGGEL